MLRCTRAEGERLRAQRKQGRMVEPTQPELQWTAPREEGQPAAHVGLDAFSVPMQGIGVKAEYRTLYTELLYTPQKEHSRYRVDIDLDALTEQVRSQARAWGIRIGECLKGSGMRWVEDGAVTVAALRALDVISGKVWDGFWAQPHRAAA